MSDPITGTEVVIHKAAEIDKADITAEMVTAALIESRSWLTVAMDGTDPTPIAEFKQWAITVETATKQKKLGHEIEMDAAEMVRRAERGIGVAIRNGQEQGEIETLDEARRRAMVQREVNQGRVDQTALTDLIKPKPTDYAGPDELSSSRGGIYEVTDGVTEEQFEEAVTEAKTEGNLSRANVVRKVRKKASGGTTRKQRADRIAEMAEKGHSSRQIAKTIGIGREAVADIARDYGIEVPADKVIGKTRLHDPNRIARETVDALAGLAMGVELIEDYADLDTGEAAHWDASLKESLRALNRFHDKIRKAHQ